MADSNSKKRQNLLWAGGIVLLLGLSGLSYLTKAKEMAGQASSSAELPATTAPKEVPTKVSAAPAPSEVAEEPPVEDFSLLDEIRKAPHVVYRSVRAKEFGRMVVAKLDDREGARFVSQLKCNRAYFDRKGGICMVDNRAQHKPVAYALLVDEHFEEDHRLDLKGFPSRTRLSSDGLFAATTVFTTGDDYEAEFSTRTMAINRVSGVPLPDLEQFEVYEKGKRIQGEDFNFWGITFFKDSNQFHATLRTGDKTYLLKGDMEKRRLDVLLENVECPSLSPDEKRIAFKKLVKKPGDWRVHVMVLATLKDRPVSGEQGSIDDQIEWFDNKHILYGTVADRGAPAEAMNVWKTPVGGGEPELFLKGASSPSVVR